jgi:hypothetical protein
MNGRQLGYGLLCAVALFYLLAANARGYVPFAGPFGRSSGFSTAGGHYIFHK